MKKMWEKIKIIKNKKILTYRFKVNKNKLKKKGNI